MGTTTQNSNTVSFTKVKSSRSKPKKAVADQHTFLRLKCSDALQSTLELTELLKLFFKEVASELPIGGLSYRHDKLDETIQFGRAGTHSCHYKLVTKNISHGELTLSRGRKFSDRDLQVLEVLISCMVQPLRNALLYREALQTAFKDSLTGAGNRAALEMTLSREIGLAKRHRQDLTVLFVDIDKFKAINDTHGHATGDFVLADIARQLSRCCRDTDAIFRYGGEEFIVAMSQTNLDGALTMAERIRQAVAAMTTTVNDQSIHITISIGIAKLHSDDTMHNLFKRADQALYQAKSQGRNRVVCAEPVDANDAKKETVDIEKLIALRETETCKV